MKITKEEYDALSNKVEELKKALNGGKGSGNFGHAGRPGEVGGSSTTGNRLARGDKVAELKAKFRDAEKEYDDYIMHRYSGGEENYDESKAEALADAANKARDEYRKAEADNIEKSKDEIASGQEKKRGKNTLGKKETARALESTKADMEASTRAFEEYRNAPEGKKEELKKKYDEAYQKTIASGRKLEKAVTNQMTNDKQFVSDIKEHIEKGLGIKLGNDFNLKVDTVKKGSPDEFKAVTANVKISPKDLGAFGKVLSRANVELYTTMGKSESDLGRMWGRMNLRYQSRGGGENGQNLFSVSYSPDGTYRIDDERGGF